MKKLIGTTIVKSVPHLLLANKIEQDKDIKPAPTPEEKAILDKLAK
ncbi:hypothetical protein [Lysobacter sp. CA196]